MTGRKLASVVEEEAALAGFSRVAVSMVLTDPRADDNPIVYVNTAFEQTTGYSRAAAIGRNCRFLQGEDTDKTAVDRIRDAVANTRDITVDILNYRADGSPFRNRLIIAPIKDSDGEVIYFLGIQKELYEAERTREEVGAQLERVRERVTGDLSLLLAGIGAPDVGKEGGGFDHAAMSRRLEALQLLYEELQLTDSHGGPEAGARAGNRAGIDLGSLLSRVAGAIAHEAGRPGLRYAQSIEALTVNLDSGVRLSLLLSEVLSNAFEHAFERIDEGFIDLRVSRLAAGGLRIVVGDDGVGLPRGAAYPDPRTVGGRLMGALVEGLDASITAVRGAAGTVVMIDVPVGVTET